MAMTFKEYLKSYGNLKMDDETRFNKVMEAKARFAPRDDLKMKASLERDLELYNHIEKGLGIISGSILNVGVCCKTHFQHSFGSMSIVGVGFV